MFHRVALLAAVSSLLAAVEFRIGCYDGYAPKDVTEPFVKLVKERLGKDITCVQVTMTDNATIYDALRGKKVDVVSPTNNGIKAERFKLIQSGFLSPVDVQALSHWKELVPAIAASDHISDGGKAYGVPLNYAPYGLAYNTAKLPAAPTTWKALVQAKGGFAVSNDWEVCVMAVAGLIAGLPKEDIFTFEKLNTPAVKAVARQMASTTHRWTGVDDVATLKGQEVATSWGFAFADLAKAGETWAMAEPVEGSPWYLDSFAVAAAASPEVRDVALLWLDHVISPEIQAIYVRTLGVKSVTLGAKALLTPEEARGASLDDPTFFSTKVALLKPLSIRDENGVKRLWDEAKAGK